MLVSVKNINLETLIPMPKRNGIGCPQCSSELLDSAYQTSDVKIEVECSNCDYRAFRVFGSYKTIQHR